MQNKDETTATQAKSLILLFGAYDLDDFYETGKTVLSPSEIKTHKNWNPFVKRFHDDIAVLLLESDVQYSEYIRPICMLTEDENHNIRITDGTVAGWGKSEDATKKNENIPRKLDLPIVASNEKCYRDNSLFAIIGSEKSFCAGQPGVGVCLGDSGSAFIVKINNKFYFKGLVSSSLVSNTGCYTDDYAIYTDVPKYFDFIQNPTETCGVMSSSTSLIRGGTFSSREQFPWLVSVWK